MSDDEPGWVVMVTVITLGRQTGRLEGRKEGGAPPSPPPPQERKKLRCGLN